MAFIYDVDLTVHSVIDNLSPNGIPEADSEINLFTVGGFMRICDECTTLSYTENTEGGKVFCELKIYGGTRIELSRGGAVQCKMVFEHGKEQKTIYSIPPYSFDMTVTAKKVKADISKSGGEIRLVYLMNIGGQDKSCTMRITVKAL